MNVITPLIQFQQQLRIYHWQTDSYAAHKELVSFLRKCINFLTNKLNKIHYWLIRYDVK
jgi:hypothetical protein